MPFFCCKKLFKPQYLGQSTHALAKTLVLGAKNSKNQAKYSLGFYLPFFFVFFLLFTFFSL
jgi:hypothetical protein